MPQQPLPVSPEEEAATIIRTLDAAVQAIAAFVPGYLEVVVHDLAKLPESIVAIAGGVTGRRVGDPATDVLLEAITGGGEASAMLEPYTTVLPDGRALTSSTTIIRTTSGEPVAALCVNTDLEAPARLRALLDTLVPAATVVAAERPLHGGAGERFAHDVDELADHLIADTLARTGIPVDLMRKEHKVAVVARLQTRGMFLLKDSVETVAKALHVTRFTIYNYLNELEGEGESEGSPDTAARGGGPDSAELAGRV